MVCSCWRGHAEVRKIIGILIWTRSASNLAQAMLCSSVPTLPGCSSLVTCSSVRTLPVPSTLRFEVFLSSKNSIEENLTCRYHDTRQQCPHCTSDLAALTRLQSATPSPETNLVHVTVPKSSHASKSIPSTPIDRQNTCDWHDWLTLSAWTQYDVKGQSTPSSRDHTCAPLAEIAANTRQVCHELIVITRT